MKVVGFSGFSGSGKTTLVEQLIAVLRLRGLRVSVVKHAHHSFDIDHPGKDSFRHREAGAYEVVVASTQRLAIVRQYEVPVHHTVHQLIAELSEIGRRTMGLRPPRRQNEAPSAPRPEPVLGRWKDFLAET